MAIKVRRLRWWIIGLLMLGSIINYLTRSTLSVAAPTLRDTLNITPEQYSWITTAFQVAIMLQPIAGYVLDVVGLKIGMAIFAVAWSVISMSHGLATSWQGLAGLRGLLGLAEGCANPAGVKAISEWFPAKERGFAGGVFNMGASAGSMIAAPLVAWAIIAHSWQFAFVLTGGIGLVWAALWLIFYNSPTKHTALSEEERQHIQAGQEQHLAGVGRPAIGTILRQRNFWGIAIPRFLADPTWGTLTYWLPLYLVDERGFALREIALFAWLPFLAADLGCLSGATIAATLQKYFSISLINARRFAFTAGALMMTAVAFTGFVENTYVAIGLLCAAGFAHQTLSVTVITMASDLFKRNEVATVAGMAGTMGNLGLTLFNLAIGVLVATAGFSRFFIALAVLDLVGAAVLWILVKDPQKGAPASATPAVAA